MLTAMKIEDLIKKALGKMIERKLGITNVVVSSWDEQYYPGDPEATCEYCGADDSYDVVIHYFTPSKDSLAYNYDGSFGDLIKELDIE
jgi:hypothetical protein